MKTALKLPLYCLLALIPLFGQSQQGFFRYYTVDQGLSSNEGYSHQCILQDKQGYLWISTHNGLNRFDGKAFKPFNGKLGNTNGLASSALTAICEDLEGKIWIGTDAEGLYCFDPRNEKFVQFKADDRNPLALRGNSIYALLPDPSGDIWIGTRFNGVCRYLQKNKTFKQIPVDLGEVNARKPRVAGFSLLKTKDGILWLGSNHGLHRYDPQKGAFSLPLKPNPGLPPTFQYISDLVEAPNGELWTTSGYRGHKIFNPQTQIFRDYPLTLGLENQAIVRCLGIDKLGNIWIGTENTIYKYETQQVRVQVYKIQPNRNPSAVFSALQPGNLRAATYLPSDLFFDQAGSLWAMTTGNGLIRLHQPEISFELISKDVVHFAKALDNKFYLLTANGVRVFDPQSEQVSAQQLPPALQKQKGYCIYAFPNHEIVVVSGEPDQAHFYNLRTQQFRSIRFNGSLAVDKNNHYWFSSLQVNEELPGSTWHNVIEVWNKYYGKKWSEEYFGTLVDQKGRIWVGLGGEGLYVWEPKKQGFKSFKATPENPNSILGNRVETLYADRQGWIYAAMSEGLSVIDSQLRVFRHFTTAEGLSHNRINSIAEDNEGNIWLGTGAGLSFLDKKNWTFRNIRKSEGLPDIPMVNSSVGNNLQVDQKGRVYFVAGNNLYRFYPEKKAPVQWLAPMNIDALWVNNREIKPGTKDQLLSQRISQTKHLKLNWKQSNLGFSFVSPSFIRPHELEYFYQLKNYDQDWYSSGSINKATYANVPPGRYVFRAKARTSNGQWTPKEAQLSIVITPPWWRTWVAYLFYLLALGLSVRVYFRFQLKRAKLQEQLAFETREAERVKELDALKTRFYTNITHELRTPLTVIMGMAQQALENPAQYFRHSQEMIIRNGQHLLKLINELLDLSKIEHNKMDLELVQGDVVVFLKYILESFHSFASSKKLQLHLLLELDSLIMDYDPERLRQIVFNLLSNALKFTPEGGHVYFSINQPSPEYLVLKVRDTGIGIPAEQVERVFDRFYQVDGSSTRKSEGTGIGLALTKELVKLMGGEISVKSPVTGSNKGSEFVVRLPIQNTALLQEAILPDLPALPVSTFTDLPIDADPSEVLASKSPLILIVEDNPDVVTYLRACLNDYQLEIASDGQMGLNMATTLIPDLIISDVMMPIMDGFELCQQVKTDERSSHIPIILLTAKVDKGSKLEGLERGADVYLEKPFEKEELLVRVRKLLELRGKLQLHYQQSIHSTDSILITSEISDLVKSEDAFVKKVREVIEAHLSDFNFNVEQLSKAVFLSQSQLNRKLDALIGISSNQFIRELRLKQAQNLLLDPAQSITAIAFDCGFSDPGYFARVFKQSFGVTPQEWRMRKKDDKS